MNVPKIKFRIMTLKENIELIKWSYFQKNGLIDIYNYTIKCFPNLLNINNNATNEQIYETIEKEVTLDYEKRLKEIDLEVKRYNNLWKQYNDEYFVKLSELLRVEWPNDIKIIDASVGLIPVFPRYLDDFSFSVGVNLEESKLIETCAHESLHFLWFEKWKKIYSGTPREEFDSPYIVWQYSEMVTDPILNNEPFLELFDFVERGYDSFYEITDDEELIMDKLRTIYGKDISIEQKISDGFDLVKNNIVNYKNK